MFKNKMFLKKLSFNSALLIIGILITSKAILAWSSPASVPPDGNISAPLNTGPNGQIKTGTLEVNGGFLLGDTSAGITGAFSVNNLDFLVTPTGNVGIGATSTAKLNVAGDINYTGNLLQNGVPLSFGGQWDTSGNNIYNTNIGNVGIGTTSPSTKLQVNTPSGGSRALQLGVSNQEQFVFETGITAQTNAALIVKDITTPYSYLTLRSGNVGIGTTNPNAKLQVAGQITGGFGAVETGGTLDWNHSSNAQSGSGYSLLYGNAANGPGPANYFHPFSFEYSSKNGGGNMTQLAIPYLNAYGNSSDSLWLRSRYGGTWYPWRQILTENYNGNVGIGTINPTGQMAGTVGLGIYHDSYPAIGLKNSSGSWLWWANGNTFRMYNNAVGDIITANNSGNVGIGTASPSYKLHVAGDVYADGGWFRVSGSRGLYQESHGLYIWPIDNNSNYWGSRSDYGWRYQDRSGNNRGYTYFDSSGFGLLSSDGSWRVRTSPGYQELYGTTYGADAQFNNYYLRGNNAYGFMGSSVYADTINTGIAGDPLELNYQRSGDIRFTGGDLTMGDGRLVYPGSISGMGSFQKSYYLASHSGWGLYTNTGIYAAGSSAFPFIYDANNTGYYLDPNGNSIMANIHTDANLLNWPGYNGLAQAYGHYIWPGRNDGSGAYWQQSWYLASNGSYGLYSNTGLYTGGPLYSPMMYDNNNTNYYVDPNSSSRMNGATFDDASSYNFYKIGSNSGYIYPTSIYVAYAQTSGTGMINAVASCPWNYNVSGCAQYFNYYCWGGTACELLGSFPYGNGCRAEAYSSYSDGTIYSYAYCAL